MHRRPNGPRLSQRHTIPLLAAAPPFFSDLLGAFFGAQRVDRLSAGRAPDKVRRVNHDPDGGGGPRQGGGLRYMALSALAFSLMALLVKEAGRRLPSSEIVLVRAAVTLAFSWALIRRAGLSWRGNRRGLLFLRGVLGFVALTSFYYAVVHLPLADATVIQYTNPVFAALIAAAALGERLRRREVALILVSLGGVILAARPRFLFGGAALPPLPVAVGLMGALFSAAAYVAVRKLGETDDTMVIVFHFSAVATVGAIPLAAGSALWPTPLEWLVLIGVGVATQLGQIFMTIGLRKEKAGRATAASYLAVAFAAAWGFLFYGEVPSVWLAAGALIIVAATVALGRIRAASPDRGATRRRPWRARTG